MTDKVDDFIGRTFGEDNQIVVISRDLARVNPNRKYSPRPYLVFCSECAKDNEMFGDGIFHTLKGALVSGSLPCGCSWNPRLSREQWLVKVHRKCLTNGYDFLGVQGEWSGSTTILCLRCRIDGNEWSTTSIESLLIGSGCPACARVQITLGSIKSDEVMINSFICTGAFPLGTKFTRAKGKSKWKYVCPICSKDEYTLNNVCTGIFTSNSGNLQKGILSCRCAGQVIWTQQQREYQINKALSEENSKYKFVGWASTAGHLRNTSKITLFCELHGEWNAPICTFLGLGRRCPSCAKYGYNRHKNAHVYVLLATHSCGKEFTGFGITNSIKTRFATHKRNLLKEGYTITKQVQFPCSGVKALDVERDIKDTFSIVRQEIEGFRTEATHALLYNAVVYLVGSASGYYTQDIQTYNEYEDINDSSYLPRKCSDEQFVQLH
jgi:hypothetical protein